METPLGHCCRPLGKESGGSVIWRRWTAETGLQRARRLEVTALQEGLVHGRLGLRL